MRATIEKQQPSFDSYGIIFTICILTKDLRKFKFRLFLSLKNQNLTDKHFLSERGIGSCLDFLYPNYKNHNFCSCLSERYPLFATFIIVSTFYSRSQPHAHQKNLSGFFSATPSATPSLICVTMPSWLFRVFKN